MKREIICVLTLLGMVVVSAVSVPSDASAFSITSDKPKVSVDGDKDKDKKFTIKVSKKDSSKDSLSYGYFLNDSKEFKKLDDSDNHTFKGGDKIDFAVYDQSKTKYYKLSDGKDDDSYNVEVDFDDDDKKSDNKSLKQDSDEEKDGSRDAHIKWYIPDDKDTKEVVIELHEDNNGYTTVPEPATLFLMGSGLVGYALMRRKKKN